MPHSVLYAVAWHDVPDFLVLARKDREISISRECDMMSHPLNRS